ncbi:MAG TPA: hypothetical protein V6D14_13040 [Coleofasciculaceae cyanobacterium]|jgi:hypothetical protein
MLVRTVLLPSILKANPENQHAHYGMVIRLLQDLEKNGVVLLDDTHSIRASLLQDIPKWPVKFRKKAEVLLTALKKKNRFVEVSLKDEVQATCKNKPCQQGIRIAKIYLPPAILASQGCNQCAQANLSSVPSVEVVDVAEYCISDFFEFHLKPGDHVLGKGEWKQDKFEQEILIPLFRDAKNIKIYDRWIGRSILTSNADKYKLTLEWILEVFLRVYRSGSGGVFEVYSGFYTQKQAGKPPSNKTDAVTALRQLEIDMQKMHPSVRLIIKKETQPLQMPHDRYVITNQIAISIDRGCDLLLDNRTSPYPRCIRDVRIAYCSEPGKIEQAVQRLPDL